LKHRWRLEPSTMLQDGVMKFSSGSRVETELSVLRNGTGA
jgi:hypothetical protein